MMITPTINPRSVGYTQPMGVSTAAMPDMQNPFNMQASNPFEYNGKEGRNILYYKFVAAGAVECFGTVGLYLFSLGYADFRKGLASHGSLDNCLLFSRASTLAWLMPICAILRFIFTPYLWSCAERGWRFNQPIDVFAVLGWCVFFFSPFIYFTWGIILTPGVNDVFGNFVGTISAWPADCAVDRPYHGLFQTRCWACLGGFLTILGMHIWVMGSSMMCGWNCRVGAFSVGTILWTAFMISAGPFFWFKENPQPNCPDMWIANLYIAVSIPAGAAMVLLCILPCGLPEAIKPIPGNALGPFAHWSTWVFILTGIAWSLTCQWAITSGVELKKGPPWSVCGADYKEFYFPRFWGLIFFTRGQVVASILWVCGVSLTPN